MSSDKVLLIGGLSGIGQGVAEAFGDRAIVWSRRTGVDACDEAALRAALQQLDEVPFGLVHCVGDFEERPLLETDPGLYRHMVENNLTSAFAAARAIVPAMVAAGRGRVVFFAAAGAGSGPTADRAKTRAPVYFAAKAAVVSLARSLAAEVASAGVTVNVVSPGIIRHASSHQESQDRMASRVPLGRTGTVDDIVGIVKLLLSAEGSYITGADLVVDGGLSL